MARDEAYRKAEQRIEAVRTAEAKELNLNGMGLDELPESLGRLKQLEWLNLSENRLAKLPESLGQLTQLRWLDLSENRLTELPESLGQLAQLQVLHLSFNRLTGLPASFSKLKSVHQLSLGDNSFSDMPCEIFDLVRLDSLTLVRNRLATIPSAVSGLTVLRILYLEKNRLIDLPPSMAQLRSLRDLHLHDNPLNPELGAAYKEGLDAVKRYLRAKAEAQVVLNEAKLILIGEGEVGKSCLLGALRGDPWEEDRSTTHGIEIKPVKVSDPATGTEITLNAWDFGGQRVYRPTHQLFFSAPAVYLVVWKPREGPQQGFVKEWIKLVKHREPDARILVVATHGGPKERQPDIDRQDIWDLFGKETVIQFFHVESKPPKYDKKKRRWTGERRGIKQLKDVIAKLAASLPEVGRSVPKRWQEVREALKQTGEAYLPLNRVFAICTEHKMTEEEAQDFVRISHRLGHLIHYGHDPRLKDMVILKPDWLATAVSFVLDDEETRKKHGLVKFARLGKLWSDRSRGVEFRYPAKVHPIFVALMERFDLSYRVAGSPLGGESDQTSLIAQLVPDVRPEVDIAREWPEQPQAGDEQQVQMCRIVDEKGHSWTAEGLFYQLIVRLHKFSLGCEDFNASVHWQRGLILDDDYNGRALLEHVGNDVRITVRAAYPGNLLAVLTREVKWLVENFWEGLKCQVVVPCIEPCGKKLPGTGLFEVQKLIAFKRQGMTQFPCNVSGCDQAHDIDRLLRNAPAARRDPREELLAEFATVRVELTKARAQMAAFRGEAVCRFDKLDTGTQRILSKVDDAFAGLMAAYTDEAKEGPRLFSFKPVDPGFFDRPKWINQKFRLTLWCEHSRLPLPELNGKGSKAGVYELNLPREWFEQAAPFLKVLTGTLSLVLPVAASATKLVMDDTAYKGLEKELDLGQKSLDSVLKGGGKSGAWLGRSDAPDLERGEAIRAQGAVLRQLHAWLKEKDPSFGGLVRVMNKRQEFLWVHPQFEAEY
ncbi:MAG: hypothetical protein H7A46_13605 [Verrucomicrobiales bacterium]|nr:hypothetical protein [Verrucomicrobiales bacterium]